MFIIVGNMAVQNAMKPWRQPKDFDVFVNSEDETGYESFVPDGFKVDALVLENLNEYAWSSPNGFASLDELYTIKVSHSYWKLKNGTWDKHLFDIVQLKNNGAVLIEELHALLYSFWEVKHGKKKANLELSPDEFFNPHVHRKYEHDSIHASVAYYQAEGPLFNRILRDNHQVAVDKSKFDALSRDDKLNLVREEVYATALERVLIPKEYSHNQKAAYNYALTQTITSYTKGWFPKFIIDNYNDLRKPDRDFVAWHLENKDKLILI